MESAADGAERWNGHGDRRCQFFVPLNLEREVHVVFESQGWPADFDRR